MCYSVKIKTSLKELAREFQAEIDKDAILAVYQLRQKNPEVKIPLGLDQYLMESDLAPSLPPLIKSFHAEEKLRLRTKIRETEQELEALGQERSTTAVEKKIEVRQRRLEKFQHKAQSSFLESGSTSDRVFPFYFAPVILETKGQRRLQLMRYRVQNPNGSEVPAKYNVFNARLDSLLDARTWRPLFAHTHAIFPFLRFYEWVERGGKSQEVVFSPENRELMWAASLYSCAKDFCSFAMITDDPPTEVAEAGHDRCPIFLSQEKIHSWLTIAGKPPAAFLRLLKEREKTHYQHGLAAA